MKRWFLLILCVLCLCGCTMQEYPAATPTIPTTIPVPTTEITIPTEATEPTEPSTLPPADPTEPPAPTQPTVTEPAPTEPPVVYYDNSRLDITVTVTDSVVQIVSVMPDGAAALAGIRAGDVLIKLAGTDVVSNASLRNALSNIRSGATVQAQILRGSQSLDISLTLDAGVDRKGILPEYISWYERCPDVVGWLRIPGIKTDDPVMQTPGNKNYYLDHDIDGKKSSYGELYIREQCDVFAPSDNLVIYGHHMKNGTMMGQLDKYKTKSFWETHQYIYFDTLYEKHTYQVIAVFKTSGNSGEGFAYYKFNDAANAEEFDAFIATCKELSFYDTGLSAQYGDKLITLSTCEYTLNNGRFVVVAKRID